jgi:ferritin-like metal-binding protein YciE
MQDDADLLDETLNEEKETDELLTTIATGGVNSEPYSRKKSK